MMSTNRTQKGKVTNKREAPGASHSGEEIAQAARVEELRQMVSAGRYQVEPNKLALRILTRALRQPE